MTYLPTSRLLRTRVAAVTAALSGLILVSGAQSTQGQTFTWGNATGDWITGASWVGGVAPSYGADTLVFGGGAAYTSTNNFNDGDTVSPAFFMLNTLNITSTAAGSTINGPTYPNAVPLAFVGPNAAVNVSGSGSFILEHNLAAAANLSINIAPGAGAFRLGAPAGTTTNSALYGNTTVTINNNSANAMEISNFESFIGTVNIASGTVNLNQTGGGAISSLATLNIAPGATFNLNNNDDVFGALTGGGTFNLGTGYIEFDARRDQDWSGTITGTPGGTANPTEPTVLKWFGSRESVLTWRGDNTYSGETDIRAGTLRLVDGGRISGTSDNADDVDGDGVVVYQSDLILDNTGTANHNDRVNDSANVRLAGNVTLLGRAGTATTETLGNVTVGTPPGVPEQNVTTVLTSGPSTINVVNGAGGTATLTLGALTRVSTHGVTLNFAGNGTVNVTNAPALTNGIIGGWATYGNEWATMSGNTVVPYAGYQVNNNPAAWVAADNVKVTGALAGNATGGVAVNSLHISSAQTINIVDDGIIPGVLTVHTGGILATASGTVTGGTLAAGVLAGSQPDMKFHVNGASTVLTVDSLIANTNGNTSVTKTGTGTLKLTNVGNTFGATGNGLNNGVNFEGGFIEVSAREQLGLVTSQLTFAGGGIKLGADLDLSNSGGTARAISTAGVKGMTVDTNGFTLTTSSVGGYGGVVKKGAGTWIINTSNSWDGDLWIEEGIVRANGTSGSLFDSTTFAHLSPGTELDLADNDESFGGLTGTGTVTTGTSPATRVGFDANIAPPDPVVYDGVIQGGGRMEASGSYKQWLGGQSTFTGAVDILTGGLVITASAMPSQNGPLGNSTIDINLGNPTGVAPASLELGAAGVELGRNVFVAAGGVTTLGGLHATGTSTISGNVTLAHTLYVTSAGTGTVNMTGTFADALPGTEFGGLIKIGTGTVSLGGSNTYVGPTYVAEGRLDVNGTNSGGGLVTVASDATLGGSGTITGSNVDVFGTLAPGNSIESLDVSGNVNLAGTLQIEVSGANIDLLSVGGGLTLGAGSVLDIVGSLTESSYTIATFSPGTLLGTFGSFGDVTSQGYTISYQSDKIVLEGGGSVLLGDVNFDGVVDIFDVNVVSDNWGTAGPTGDANSDGVVDIFDVNVISDNWGAMAGGAAAVPEPSTWALALVGLAGVAGLRRRRNMA